MAADTVAGYIQGLLDGVKYKRMTYALDREARLASMARLMETTLLASARAEQAAA
jgi:hypothetical protein